MDGVYRIIQGMIGTTSDLHAPYALLVKFHWQAPCDDDEEEELDRQDPKRQRDHSLNRPGCAVIEVQREIHSERSEDNKRQRRRPRSLSTTSAKPPLLPPSAKELPPVKSFSIGRDAPSKSRLVSRHRAAIAAAAALSLDAEAPKRTFPEAEALPVPSLGGEVQKHGAISLHKARPYTRHRAAIRDARALCLNVESDIDRLAAPRLVRVQSVPNEAAASEATKAPKRPPRATSETRQRAVSSSWMRAQLDAGVRSSMPMHDGPK